MQVIAMRPNTSRDNAFVDLFSHSLANCGFKLKDFNWELSPFAGADYVILHWPEYFFAQPTLESRFRMAMVRFMKFVFGTKFVWVAHNIRPHDGGDVDIKAARNFLSRLDGIVFLSNASREEFEKAYPDAKAKLHTIRHGHYLDSMETRPAATPDSDHIRLLNFGQLRPYKNVDRLIHCLVDLGDDGATLTIAGLRRDAAYVSKIETLCASRPDITLDIRDDLLPQHDLEAHLDASNGVVLPYSAITNSGAAIFALSRNRPVLAPGTGVFPELQGDVGSDWVTLYEGELDTADLKSFVRKIRDFTGQSKPDLSAYDWADNSASLANFLRSL
ncbi:glycosyltransferase family 4 protein [Rhizobiales bacterium]|uniref:glycosyltransferase family 4 protein n=1 Tax=Hongsoonwoonella zoysiae TaxID=2821844 RepID=UPI00155F632F|nr:glycosyltransferase family 4 protein [Hongsoonwoonella zoysiae]NRG16316.1 glycosyltransferase family 4 protein [Hongsoonwoonella zoysiae]